LIGVGLPALRMKLRQLECAFWCKEAQGYGTKYVTISSHLYTHQSGGRLESSTSQYSPLAT